MIDTHAHLNDEAYAEDVDEVIARAKAAGIEAVFMPATDLPSCYTTLALAQQHPQYLYPMLGLHPEEVKDDYLSQLQEIRTLLQTEMDKGTPIIAIGEIGLDYYWSREYEQQQLHALHQQIEWSIDYHLPLMIHCRKAQNELVKVLREYQQDLIGGVVHCFSGNVYEAEEIMQFDNFAVGIGGIITFKKTTLPTVLPQAVPLTRVVTETDAPYLAPTPHRGTRNESAYIPLIVDAIAHAYGTTPSAVAAITADNAKRLFLQQT